jgi:succinate dehydrogenase / fumarate reductase cytochrome b subunit
MADQTPRARPLSPHLQIYRPVLTMVLSIIHRITGAALYFGVILLVWWLLAAATSDSAFATVQGFFGHWFGRLVLFGFTVAAIHHALGGIKHLMWDTGHGMRTDQIEWLAKGHVAGTVILTLLLWIVGYGAMS